jgi:hypothetical protein
MFGGPWKVPMFRGPWKVSMLSGPWKVSMLGGPWKEKEKHLLPLPTFPQQILLKPSFFY